MKTLWRLLLPGGLASASALALPPAHWIKKTYQHDHLITLDELSSWKK